MEENSEIELFMISYWADYLAHIIICLLALPGKNTILLQTILLFLYTIPIMDDCKLRSKVYLFDINCVPGISYIKILNVY
jgi:hypothetical protein